MPGRTQPSISLIILLLFIHSALSPITACAGHVEHVSIHTHSHSTCPSSTGILSIKHTLATLTGIDSEDIDADGLPECRTTLLEKKSGVMREVVHVIPLSEASTQPLVFGILFPALSGTISDAHAPFRDFSGISRLNSGLAPPFVLS